MTAARLWALIALVGFLALGGAPAAAQSDPTDPAGRDPVPLSLAWQSPFVEADGELEVRFVLGEFASLATALPQPADADAGGSSNEGDDTVGDDGVGDDGALDDLRSATGGPQVIVTVYGRVLDAAGLAAAPDVAINRLPNLPLTSLPIDADGVVTLRMPIRSQEPFDEIDRTLIPDPGVYPITVELRAGDVTLGSLRTEMIRLPAVDEADAVGTAQVGPPMSVVMPLGASGLSVREATDLLAANPDLPAAPVIGDDALADLEADPALAASFSSALGDRSVIVRVRPNLDPSGLAAIGRLDRYRRAVESARASSAALELPFDDGTTTIGASPTAEGAAELTALGFERVLDDRSLSAPRSGRSYRLPTGDGQLFVLQAAPIWSELVAEGRPPAARVQRFLAHLALSDPDAPVIVNAKPAVDGGLATLGHLIDALAEPELVALPLAELLPPSGAERAEPATRPSQDLAAVAEGSAATVAFLASYEAFHVNGPDSPGSYNVELDAALSLDADPAGRAERVAALNRRLDAELATIALPENQSVTLAAQSASIPLTIENGSAGARQILLRFRSDKIAVEEDGKLITVDPGTSSIDIEIEARSLGVSPLYVSVLTPDSQRVLSTTRFDVRSTAVPGVGLLISAVGLLVLGVWWYLSIRRKRSPSSDGPDDPPGSGVSTAEGSDRTDVLASGSV